MLSDSEKQKKRQSQLTRRSFLKTGAVISAAMCVPASVSATIAGIGKATPANTNDADYAMISQRRVLGKGKSALEVSALGLGMMGMNYHRGYHPDKETTIKLAREAVERGVIFFDTAQNYGPFTNEELTGEALAPFRNKVIVSTKCANDKYTGTALSQHLKKVTEDSLRRLNIEAIDLYYLHRYTPVAPIEEVAAVMQELIREGKIKHYGLSEVGAETIRRAHAVEPVTAIQSEYHLMWREPEKVVLPVCEELGIGFVPYSPINRGFLGGSLNEYTRFDSGNDNRDILPRFTSEALRSNYRIVEALNAFGRTRGVTSAQLALAWLMAKKPWIVSIPGTTKLSHLEENLRAADFIFAPGELEELELAVAQIPIMGERYPAIFQTTVGH